MIVLSNAAEALRVNRWPMVLIENAFADGGLSWSSQTADGFASNALGPQTYDYWTPAAMPATLQVSLSVARECNAMAIVAHNLGSKGATVIVEHMEGVSWSEDLRHSPKDDSAILMIWNGAVAASWRLRVTGPAAPSIGVVMLGKRLTIRSGVLTGYVALPHARRADLMTSTSMGGQFLGNRIKRRGAETAIEFADLPREFVDGALAPFRDHFDSGQPFIWASDPKGDKRDVGYCWRSGDELRPSYGEDGWANIAFSVEAYAE